MNDLREKLAEYFADKEVDKIFEIIKEANPSICPICNNVIWCKASDYE